MSVSEKVLDAIELLSNSAIDKAKFDKTIQAQIVSCTDATIGQYRCRYQDSIFYAYTSTSEVIYPDGSYVYILIPNGDMSQDKTILGTTKKVGLNYLAQAEGEEACDIVGTNCIITKQGFKFISSGVNRIFDASWNENENLVEINTDITNEYLRNSSAIILGGTFTVSLPPNAQRGYFGICLGLEFVSRAGDPIVREYYLNQDNMVGNPYQLNNSRQYQIFNIDGENFSQVAYIDLKADLQTQFGGGEILISNLELYGINKMSDEEINGLGLSLYTPEGSVFKDDGTDPEYLPIVAQPKVKGKIISDQQDLAFYWGVCDARITANSEKFNEYLGQGWQCLNQNNVVSDSGNSETLVKWVPGTNIFNFPLSYTSQSRYTYIKVAVVYNNHLLTKELKIVNINRLPIGMEAFNDDTDQYQTVFFNDAGVVRLKCGPVANEGSYDYIWGKFTNTNLFIPLPPQPTMSANEQKYSVATITNYTIFICSVINDAGECVGTEQIKIINSITD